MKADKITASRQMPYFCAKFLWAFFRTCDLTPLACGIFGTPRIVEYRYQMTRKAVPEMDKIKVDYILDIFRALSTEMPEQMLYRELGDSIELRTLDSAGNCGSPALLSGGWDLIVSHVAEAA